MNIPIKIESYGKISNELAPVINKVIKSSIQTSLNKVKDKWQYEVQRIFGSSTSLNIPWANNTITYPLDGDSFAGSIQLPDVTKPGSLALNIRSTQLPPRASSPFVLGRTPVIQNTVHRLNRFQRRSKESQQKSKDYAVLQRIVKGYQQKPKGNDPLKQLAHRMKRLPGKDSLVPFARLTFIDVLNTNLNGLY